MTTIWERIIRGLGVFVVITFFVAAVTPVSNIVGQKLAVTETLQPSDVIVVLGAGLMQSGTLNNESMRRTVRGVELYKQGLAPILVLLGPPFDGGSSPTEAAVRARFARTMGVPSEAIIKIENSMTTREESIHTASLLRQRNVHRIILVTESLHMRRAKLVFERTGLEVLPAISTDYPSSILRPAGRLWLAMRLVQESTALAYYRLAGYI